MLNTRILNATAPAPLSARVVRQQRPQRISIPAGQRSAGLQCAATKGSSNAGGTPPQRDAAEARSQAADAAEDAIKGAGEQLADAVGGGVQNAEGSLADTQSQAARTAGQAEVRASNVAAESATTAARSNAADAAATAADVRRQASSAASETRSTQQEDAARAENAVRDTASQAAQAVSGGIDSIPTPADVVQGAADAAADAIRGAGQAAGAASDAAKDAQKNAESFASDLQKDAQKGLREAQQTVRQMQGAAYTPGGRTLISDYAQLTSRTASSPDGKSHEEAVPHLKSRLLASVAGLDRGFAANSRQADLVEAAVNDLVSAGGPVVLSYTSPSSDTAGSAATTPATAATPTSLTTAGVTSLSAEVTSISPEPTPSPAPKKEASTGRERSTMAQLGGVWRLVYSSGFAESRTTGGRRPGVPISALPAQFGQVYQGISTDIARCDNIVEFRRMALPSLPFLPPNEPAEALLTLKHDLEIVGTRTVQISFVGTDVAVQGGIAGLLNNVPEFTLPELPEGLRPEKSQRAATFDVLFLDDDLRITRGDRNEIRVFVRT